MFLYTEISMHLPWFPTNRWKPASQSSAQEFPNSWVDLVNNSFKGRKAVVWSLVAMKLLARVVLSHLPSATAGASMSNERFRLA